MKDTPESAVNTGTETSGGFAGLGAEAAGVDRCDPPALVAVLTRVEGLIESTEEPEPRLLLEAVASALQAVVLEEASDPSSVMTAVAEAAAVVESFFAAEPSQRDTAAVAAAAQAVAAAVSGEAEMLNADQIAARLVGCTPADTEILKNLAEQLGRLLAEASTPAEAAEPLMVAAAFIEQALQASTDDADKSLASAGQYLADAIALMGGAPPAAPAEPVEAPPVEAAAPAAVEPTPAPPADRPFLPADADMEILKEYIVESLDHIEASEAALLSLEMNPDDMELVNTVFRAFHTIKGTSGFFGLDRNQALAHLAENLLDKARSGKIKLIGGYADLCLRSCDALRSMIQSVEQAEPGGALDLPAELETLMEQLADPAAANISEEAFSEPMRVGEILVGQGAVERETVEAAAETPGDKPLGERLVEQGAVGAGDVVKALRTQKQSGGGAAEATVRVATDRLDAMIDMVGELVIAQSMVAEDVAGAAGEQAQLTRNVSHAGKITRDLQDLTMSLRMVPLRGVFHRMNRLVRDLARKSGKSVQLRTEGEDTEIDRNMVELLNDPLLHMIRNSVDHGIESAGDRVAAGKAPSGSVWLRAYHSAGNVVIELQDDGQGLNRDRILAKAVDRGLIESGRDLTDSEVYALIWHPGFSTAETITDVSGRGVGMDVVKRGIDELRGRIEVASTPGAGTTFTLRLPLTMAIADAMLVRVGGERYLLPTISIEQSFRPAAGDVSTVAGAGEMVALRGDLLPLFRLHELYQVPDAITAVDEGILIAIEGEGRRCAIMVDELLGQQQVVIKSLGDAFGSIKGVAGGAILGDGRVGLILDAGGLIQLATDGEPTERLKAAG